MQLHIRIVLVLYPEDCVTVRAQSKKKEMSLRSTLYTAVELLSVYPAPSLVLY